MQLTKDAKSILFTLYKEYVDRRKHGFSRTFSKNFESSKSVHEKYFPNLIFEDVDGTLWELSDNNFIDGFSADGYMYTCCLSDYAISTLESQPKEIFLSIAEFISKFIP